MTNAPDESSISPNPQSLFIACLTALVVALVLLFAIILPAELGFDPLGAGRILGITGLSQAEDQPLENQPEVYRTDFVEFYLEPFQSVEYKYTMDLNAPLIFTWLAEGELYYDMHAEPAGLGEDFAESYEQGNASRGQGAYYAPFTGIHGWFWENRGRTDVIIRLYSAGYFVGSTVYTGGDQYDRDLMEVTESK